MSDFFARLAARATGAAAPIPQPFALEALGESTAETAPILTPPTSAQPAIPPANPVPHHHVSAVPAAVRRPPFDSATPHPTPPAPTPPANAATTPVQPVASLPYAPQSAPMAQPTPLAQPAPALPTENISHPPPSRPVLPPEASQQPPPQPSPLQAFINHIARENTAAPPLSAPPDTVSPSVTIGHIDIIVSAPSALAARAAAPPRTSGFAAYARLRRGLDR